MLQSRTFGSIHCRRLLVIVVGVNLLGVWNFGGRVVVRDDVVVMFDCGVGDGATKGRRIGGGGGDFGVVGWETR